MYLAPFAATLLVAIGLVQSAPQDGRIMVGENIRMNSQEMIGFINSIDTTWKVCLLARP